MTNIDSGIMGVAEAEETVTGGRGRLDRWVGCEKRWCTAQAVRSYPSVPELYWAKELVKEILGRDKRMATSGV